MPWDGEPYPTQEEREELARYGEPQLEWTQLREQLASSERGRANWKQAAEQARQQLAPQSGQR